MFACICYGSHSVKFAYIERENICVHVHPQLIFFKSGLRLLGSKILEQLANREHKLV